MILADGAARASRADDVAEAILARTGGEIRLGLPLGLGKPVRLVNALTRKVAERPDRHLSIFTALTLERPDMSSGMARRLMEPAADRLFGAYPRLDYARMLREGTLPANIEVSEFFFQAGRWLGNASAQRRYIAANYTDALEVLCDWRPNVVLQLLAEEEGRLSLSCNTDISVDLLARRARGDQDFLLAGEVNRELPFFGGSAEVSPGAVDHLLDDGEGFELFSVVKQPVGAVEHAIGLHVARTVKDGGTLQIGIGAIGDAVANALILRHRERLEPVLRACPFAEGRFAEAGRFEQGLYAVTEMLVDGLLHLFEEGVVSREVEGKAIHAGFFLDCRDFYRRLREMPPERRAKIGMEAVSYTNSLYGGEAARREARRDARFVNAAMKATLLGGVVSDVTSSGGEVSGIGGQFNFVEQAFALKDARAVIALPATRHAGQGLQSNIVWDHPHESVPRQYRDIVITEYGIADLRGRPDEEVVRQMLKVTDSRFQDELLEKAKAAGKVAKDFEIPGAWRSNTPEALKTWLHPFELPTFPFGTDFTETEQRLLPALSVLKAAQSSRREMARLMAEGLRHRPDEAERAALERMGLDRASGREWLEAAALRGALRRSRD